MRAVYSRGNDELIGQQVGENRSYYLHNAHGDVTERLDNSGGVLKRYDYDSFGNILNPAAVGDPDDPLYVDQNPFGYCGEYLDRETQEIYLRARYYDSTSGRFNCEDPTRDGVNWYGYCDGDAVNRSDPSGLSWLGNLWNTVKKGAQKIVETVKNVVKKATSVVVQTAVKATQAINKVASNVKATWALDRTLEQQYHATHHAVPVLNNVFDARLVGAVGEIIEHRETINDVGNTYNIPSEAIGSIIIKEQYTQSIPDFAVVTLAYLGRNTGSTGLGAIQAETAREAWAYVDPQIAVTLPASNADLLKKLADDDEFNIETIAVVLCHKAMLAGIDLSEGDLTEEEIELLFTKYNGLAEYGEKTIQYMPYVSMLLQ